MYSNSAFRNWDLHPRYELKRILGSGSYGEVAEAVDRDRGGKRVAVKKINRIFEQETDAKRILREIYILRHMAHRNVIQLLNVLLPTRADKNTFNELYLVFEFVDTDLYKLIMSPQYLTAQHIRTFLYQLLHSLAYTHSLNVIHRDVKPANILLNEDCSLKLCDFGLARVLADRGGRVSWSFVRSVDV